jgi:poly-gamma-glutamate synthesis protein (capsule biosynthesis protein)
VDSNAVDLLFGHSSHHPKGIEIYKEHPLFYGCGDLFNDYEGISGRKKYRGELRMMYFPCLNTDGTLASLTLQPVTTKRFQLHTSTKKDTQWLLETIKRESRKLDTNLEPYLN